MIVQQALARVLLSYETPSFAGRSKGTLHHDTSVTSVPKKGLTHSPGKTFRQPGTAIFLLRVPHPPLPSFLPVLSRIASPPLCTKQQLDLLVGPTTVYSTANLSAGFPAGTQIALCPPDKSRSRVPPWGRQQGHREHENGVTRFSTKTE